MMVLQCSFDFVTSDLFGFIGFSQIGLEGVTLKYYLYDHDDNIKTRR
jgi:hypothetical protein